VEKFCTTGEATDGNMAHAHCMLYTSGSKQTLRIRNTYCLSTTKMVTRRILNVTSTRTLSLWLIIAPSRTIPKPRDLTFIDICVFCFVPCTNFGLNRQCSLTFLGVHSVLPVQCQNVTPYRPRPHLILTPTYSSSLPQFTRLVDKEAAS